VARRASPWGHSDRLSDPPVRLGRFGGILYAMTVSIGTFNLNNLFSRFNLEADISTASTSVTAQTTFNFSDPAGYRIRKYEGRLVKGKDPADRAKLMERITRIDRRARVSNRCLL
jgi:hypothetical protein